MAPTVLHWQYCSMTPADCYYYYLSHQTSRQSSAHNYQCPRLLATFCFPRDQLFCWADQHWTNCFTHSSSLPPPCASWHVDCSLSCPRCSGTCLWGHLLPYRFFWSWGLGWPYWWCLVCPNCHGHGGRTFKCYFFEGRVGRAFSASLFQGTRYLVNALGSDQSLTIHWHFMAHYSIFYIYPTSLTI